MCEPATILLAASFVAETGKAVVTHIAEKKQYNANKKASLDALRINQRDLSMRQQEETLAAGEQLQQGKLQSQQAGATAQASAAEAGVSGMSVDLLLGDIDRQAGMYRQSVDTNLNTTISQLEREKQGATANAESRINSVAQPSLVNTGLQIAGAGIDFANSLRIRKPKSGS